MAAPREDDPGIDVVRAGGAALTVLLLVGVVAVAAGAAGPAASGSAGDELTDPLATALFVVGAVWVAAMLVASPLLSGMTLTAGEPRPRRWHGNVLAGAIFLTLVLAAFALLRRGRRGGEGGRTTPDNTTTSRLDEEPSRRLPGIDATDVDWLVVGLVFGVALVSFGIRAAVIVRPRGRSVGELEARKALEATLEETLDDLRSERDPRRAVIGAYARMERSLSAYGLPRRPWEAPLEYLARVIEQLTGSGSAARRLTRLFERAKFSEHSIDARMKEDAIDAVQAVRDDLRSLTVA